VRTPKPDAVFRVLYLGDEAVFAAEFEEAEGFCELIENRLANATGPKVEVINGGVPGYCPLLSFLHFKHQLASLDPDLIVLNVDMSDVADDHYYRRHARINSENVPEICAHPRLENSSQKKKLPGSGLLLVQALKRQLGLLPADDDRLSDEEDFATEAGRYAWTREEDPRWQVSIEQTFAPIRHLRELALQTSCRIVVTTIPAPWQISKNAMPDPAAREKWGLALHRQYNPQLALAPLSEFLKQQAIAFCDPTAAFLADSQPETLFLETAPRLSRRGHQVFANVVAEYLRNAGKIVRPASPFAPRDNALSRRERRQ